jgi:UDP-N-acetylglucosamine 2-epimerase (non-hydrolysing)
VKITCEAGARPNFMKIKPVLDALERAGNETELVHTGQHYDAAMSDVFFDDLGLRPPDVHLEAGSGSHAEQTARVMVAFERHITGNRPDWVVVVGDVNSTLACALVGAKEGCRVAHVEAGLRSGDWSMPEEVNRVATDRVSDLLLAPSPYAVENLRSEGYAEYRIQLVGNVMIDTLRANLDRALGRPALADLGLTPGGYALLTLHRPSNVDDEAVLAGLLEAVATIAARLPVVWPAHPRVRARLEERQLPAGLRVVEPAGYLDFLALQDGARLVLTDSGGVQEETTALGVPCLTLRTTTERPITVTEGTNRLVGVDPAEVVEAADEVLTRGVTPRCPALWDGAAGDRIARAIEHFGASGADLRDRTEELV